MRGIVLNQKDITSLIDTGKVTIFVPSSEKKILHSIYKKGEPLFVKERFQVVSCWEDTWNGWMDCEIYTGRTIRCRVIQKLSGRYGLKDGWCIFGVSVKEKLVSVAYARKERDV